jgi:hypothetical protein
MQSIILQKNISNAKIDIEITFTHTRKPLHCEKSLFVLASRQKISVLRIENPAVDTRTICLLPIEFFLKYPCQKSYGRKFPARNNRYGRKIPAFWCQKR